MSLIESKFEDFEYLRFAHNIKSFKKNLLSLVENRLFRSIKEMWEKIDSTCLVKGLLWYNDYLCLDRPVGRRKQEWKPTIREREVDWWQMADYEANSSMASVRLTFWGRRRSPLPFWSCVVVGKFIAGSWLVFTTRRCSHLQTARSIDSARRTVYEIRDSAHWRNNC